MESIIRKFSFRTQFIAFFTLFTTLLFIIVGFQADLYIQGRYNEYVNTKRAEYADSIISMIKDNYYAGQFDVKYYSILGDILLNHGVLITIDDEVNEIVFSTMQYYNPENNNTAPLPWVEPNQETEYDLDDIPPNQIYTMQLISGDNKVTIELVQLQYDSFWGADQHFMNSIRFYLFLIMLFTVLIVSILGRFVLNRFEKPLQQTLVKLSNIKKGNFTDNTHIEIYSTEIDTLKEGVESLQTTLYYQRNLKNKLLNDISHELRTPIAIVQANLEAMCDGIVEPSVEHLSECHDELVMINRMIEQISIMLDLNNRDLDIKEIDLKKSFDSILNLFVYSFSTRNMELDVQIDDVHAEVDEDSMKRVLYNLLHNAAKYSPDNTKVHVSLKDYNKDFCLIVQDEGYGISKEEMPYIFEYLYRGDLQENKLKMEGKGIGLSIVKEIINQHHGQIMLKSEVNKGTTFTIWIPKKYTPTEEELKSY